MILSVTLIAQGYAKNSMSVEKQKITFIMLAVNLVIYVAMNIWKTVGISSTQVNFLYDTAPGIIILLIRMLLFVYFVYAIYHTVKQEQIQSKIFFYFKFGVFTSIWFLILPLFVLFALAMHDYRRMVFISAIFATNGNLLIFYFLFFILLFLSFCFTCFKIFLVLLVLLIWCGQVTSTIILL